MSFRDVFGALILVDGCDEEYTTYKNLVPSTFKGFFADICVPGETCASHGRWMIKQTGIVVLSYHCENLT